MSFHGNNYTLSVKAKSHFRAGHSAALSSFFLFKPLSIQPVTWPLHNCCMPFYLVASALLRCHRSLLSNEFGTKTSHSGCVPHKQLRENFRNFLVKAAGSKCNYVMGVTDRKGRPNLSLGDKYLKYGKKVVAHYESKGFEIIHSTSSSSYKRIKGLKRSYSCATISSIPWI